MDEKCKRIQLCNAHLEVGLPENHKRYIRTLETVCLRVPGSVFTGSTARIAPFAPMILCATVSLC